MSSQTLWVGTRTVGRPQLLSTITTLSNSRDLVQGFIVVGSLDPIAALALRELAKRLQVVHLDGTRPVGQAMADVLIQFQHVKADYVLTVDDDVMFSRFDLLRCLEEFGRGGVDIITVPFRSEQWSESYMRSWEHCPVVDANFTMLKHSLVINMTNEEIEALREVASGEEFGILTWSWVKRAQGRFRLLWYPERLFHLFQEGSSRNWSEVTYEDWDWMVFRVLQAHSFAEVTSCLKDWRLFVQVLREQGRSEALARWQREVKVRNGEPHF